jgi:hypothetical protein
LYGIVFSQCKIPAIKTVVIGAVIGTVEGNLGAVKGQKRAVVFEKSSRESSEGPGNPEATGHDCKSG